MIISILIAIKLMTLQIHQHTQKHKRSASRHNTVRILEYSVWYSLEYCCWPVALNKIAKPIKYKYRTECVLPCTLLATASSRLFVKENDNSKASY